MSGQSILIIDDTPVSLKVTNLLLTNAGFNVRTVPDAEQALDLLESFRPVLILVDIQLPGMDGLEFTRRVKADPRTRDVIVVALTAFAMRDNEQRALDAGCDGYITKPIDSRTLLVRVRECLATGDRPPLASHPIPAAPVSEPSEPSELEELRRDFLTQARRQSRQLLESFDAGFNPAEACKLMHQWVGSAGILEYSKVASIARELEELLQHRPLDPEPVRELLDRMVCALATPDAVTARLGGRTIALVGFTQIDGERLCKQLARVQATARLYPPAEPLNADAIEGCHLLMIQVGAQTLSSAWLNGGAPSVSGKPTVLFGDRDTLGRLETAIHERASEFLVEPWETEEAIVRASRALMSSSPKTPPAPRFPAAPRRPDVLVADDDPIVLSIVRSTLRNHGMDVRTATNGIEALDQLRLQIPDAAILDVNMPGMDGFALLTQIRADKLAVNVILLTARQQQNDLWQGFNLGAHDYVIKPFSPMELVARVKRLLPAR